MTKFILNYLQKFNRSTSGVAATEFALIAPIVLILMLSVVDVSNAVSESFDLKTAARVGAEYALNNSDDIAGIRAAAIAATNNTTSTFTIASTVFCECDKVALVCGQTCPLDASVPNQYVRVSVQDSFSPLFLPDTFSTLGAEVTLPIQ